MLFFKYNFNLFYNAVFDHIVGITTLPERLLKFFIFGLIVNIPVRVYRKFKIANLNFRNIMILNCNKSGFICHMFSVCIVNSIAIMDVFGCSGDGTTMRFHFRFRKSSSQFTIMEKSIKNKFLTFRQEQKSQNVVYC